MFKFLLYLIAMLLLGTNDANYMLLMSAITNAKYYSI